MRTFERTLRGAGEPSDPPDIPDEPADVLEPPSRPPLPVLGLDRRTVTLGAVALVAAWLVFVFGRAVSDAAAVSERAAELRSGNATLATQLERRQAELETIQSPAFVQLEARAFGLGTAREQVFSLRPGSPSPPPIVPLGDDAASHAAKSPLDAWLDLLFGN
jgi:hypothetical protein